MDFRGFGHDSYNVCKPGFGGQEHIEFAKKIRDAKEMIDARGLKVDIEVDGE